MTTFSFHHVEQDDFTEVLNLFWNDFMPFEPATRLIKFCNKNNYKIHNLDIMLNSLLEQNTCYLAKTETGEIAGVIFCLLDKINDMTDNPPKKTELLSQGWPEDFTKVLLLLDQACNHKVLMNNKKVTEKLDLYAIVVKEKYRCQGLANKLIAKAMHEAKKMGISLISITCTSSFTQRCCIKLGFNIENEILYKDWYCDNIKVCNNDEIDPLHTSIVVYSKFI
jgi:predicted GNAT family acetyltransferase